MYLALFSYNTQTHSEFAIKRKNSVINRHHVIFRNQEFLCFLMRVLRCHWRVQTWPGQLQSGPKCILCGNKFARGGPGRLIFTPECILVSRGWHLACSLSPRIVSSYAGRPVSHIVTVSALHSPAIFRCLQIIMITSLLPQWHRDVRGRVRGAGDTYWWSGHLTWLHTIDTPPHTGAIVSTHYYYNNPMFSPHSPPSLSPGDMTCNGRKCSITPCLPGHHQWSPCQPWVTSVTALPIPAMSDWGLFIFYRKTYHNLCCWVFCE